MMLIGQNYYDQTKPLNTLINEKYKKIVTRPTGLRAFIFGTCDHLKVFYSGYSTNAKRDT